MIAFDVYAEPIAQPRQRFMATKFGARPYKDAKHPVHVFKAAVRRAAARNFSGVPLDGPLVLWVLFAMPRPSRLIWKTRPMPRVEHIAKPDADNLMKAVKDALTGLIWVDDSQVWLETPVKVYSAGNEKPHVEITIQEWSLSNVISASHLPFLQGPGSDSGGSLRLPEL